MSKDKYDINFFLNYLVSPNREPIRDLEQDEEFKKAYNRFIVNRFLSINPRTNRAAFLLNRFTFSFPKEIFLPLQYSLTPKLGQFGSFYYPYPKKKKESSYPQEVIDAVRKAQDLYHLTTKEIEEIIELNIRNNPSGFVSFLLKAGFEPKFIKKHFPELSDRVSVKVKKITKKERREILKLVSGSIPREEKIADKEEIDEIL